MEGGDEAGEAQTGPSDIKEKVLGDHVTLQRGISYKSCLLDLPGPYLLGLGTIGKNGGFRGDSLRTYGGDSPEKLIIRPGDLYISLKDVTQTGDLLGAVSRVPPYVPEGRLTQDTVKLIFKDDTISKDYVYWVLRTPQYRAYCKNRGTGTTNLDLSRNDFLIFPIPELTAERAGLVDTFEDVEGKIELNRRMNATLEAMARALFRSWFVDFDPVRAKAEGREPAGMDAATAALFPDEFENSDLGEIPKGWRVMRIDELAEINSWSLTNSYTIDPIDYIEISEVSKGEVYSIQRYPMGKEPSRARRRLRHGDTVLSTVRPDRESYFLAYEPEPTLIASTGFAVVTPTIAPWTFVHVALTRPEIFEYLGQVADGGAYPAIRSDVVARIEMMWPANPALVQQYHRQCEGWLAMAERNKQQSRTLAALRDVLLPRLLAGEIPVLSTIPSGVDAR